MKTSTYRQTAPTATNTFKSEESARIAKASEYQSKCVANWLKTK